MVQGEGLLWPRLLLIPLGLLGLTPTWVMDELVQPAGHKTSLQHMPNLFVELAPEGTARRHCPSNLWWEEVTGGNMELRFPSSWGESVRQCRCNYIMLPFYLWHFSKWHWLADRWLKVFTKKIKECTKRNGGKNYGEAESTNQEIEKKKVENILMIPYSPDGNSVLKVESPGDEGIAHVPSPGNADIKVRTHL